jgi:hypothetical protein
MSSTGVRPPPTDTVSLASDAFDAAPMPHKLAAQGWNLNGDSPLYDSQVSRRTNRLPLCFQIQPGEKCCW